MKEVLVVYYSQTGQLHDIIRYDDLIDELIALFSQWNSIIVFFKALGLQGRWQGLMLY